jgi:pimeloyl-ACP methyl ester carboxylesterase
MGQPVVVLHGTPGSHRLGGLFASAAAEQGVRLLAVDRPGYGDSDPWPERRLTDIGDIVAAVLDDAGVAAAGLIGFSGGGPHALAVAATHGDRVSRVDVLSGSTPPTVGDEPPAMQRLLAKMAASTPRLLGGLFSSQAWIAANLSPSPFLSQYTDREIETFDQRVVDLLTDDFVTAVDGSGNGVATEFRLLAREWGFQVEAVDQPVRFWHGEQDANVPLAGVQQLSQRLPNSELMTISEGDHLSTLLDCRERVVDCHARAK